jgi:soluble lytic murein transglycosylase-like protein
MKRWMRLATICLGLCGPALAHAALYGYIDEQGTAHFASEKLDSRYTLFMRDNETKAVGNGVTIVGGSKGSVNDKLYRNVVNHPNLPKVDPLIREVARQYGVDTALVKAVIAAESGFNATALSPKGAIGLMQVIPDTGSRFGVAGDGKRTLEQKLYDPRINIATGVRYLAELMIMFPGNLELVLAAYNAGEGAVQKYRNQVPPYAETQNYVKTVMQFYRFYNPLASSGVTGGITGGATVGAAAGRVRVVVDGRRNMPE